jgi:hypothetical protein
MDKLLNISRSSIYSYLFGVLFTTLLISGCTGCKDALEKKGIGNVPSGNLLEEIEETIKDIKQKMDNLICEIENEPGVDQDKRTKWREDFRTDIVEAHKDLSIKELKEKLKDLKTKNSKYNLAEKIKQAEAEGKDHIELPPTAEGINRIPLLHARVKLKIEAWLELLAKLKIKEAELAKIKLPSRR